MRTAVVSATALVAYLWLCLTWFDHDVLSSLAGAPPAIPALVLVTALGTLVVLQAKRWPGLSEDGRIALAIASVSLATRLPFLWGAIMASY